MAYFDYSSYDMRYDCPAGIHEVLSERLRNGEDVFEEMDRNPRIHLMGERILAELDLALKPLTDALDRSERLTEADFNIRINARDDDVRYVPEFGPNY